MEPQPQTSPVVPSEPVAEQKLPRSNKNLKILLLVFLFLLLGTVIVYAYQSYQSQQVKLPPPPEPPIRPTSTIDETGEWKTYRDPTLSYEFKYPSHLILANLEGINGVSLSTNSPDDPIQDETTPFVVVVQDEQLSGNINLSEWAKEKTTRQMPDGTTRSSIHGSITSYTKIQDEAIIFDTLVENEFQNIYVKSKNNLVVMFSLIAGYDTGSSYKESIEGQQILNQILSSFRFVEEEGFNFTGWQTFTNKNSRYSVMYPPDWKLGPEWSEKRTDLKEWQFFGNGTQSISIAIKSKTGYSSIDEYMKEPQALEEGEVVSQQDVLIGNQKARIMVQKGMHTYKNAYIEYEDAIYIISTIIDDSTDEETFSQFISSLRFLE